MDTDAIGDLSRGELRKFGLTTGAVFAGIFGAFIPWVWEFQYPLWPWAILAVLGFLALAAPEALRPVHKYWMRFGLLISKVTTPIILGIVFYIVIMPVGLIKRIFGEDPLRRKYDADVETYRIDSSDNPVDNLEKPY